MPEAHPIDLAFVGSGNAFAPGRCWSGFMLGQQFLFDAPPTALYSLKLLGMPLGALHTIFLSHFHADHFFGLPFLLIEYAYLTHRTENLTIVGPPETEDRLSRLIELGYPSLNRAERGYELRFVEVDDGSQHKVNGLSVESIEVDHGGELLRCFGFRVGENGRTLAYTGDTNYCDQLERLARDADVLVTDCTYAEGFNNPEHMSLDEVRVLQEKVGGDTQFVLTHLGQDVDIGDARRMTVASDLARYRF